MLEFRQRKDHCGLCEWGRWEDLSFQNRKQFGQWRERFQEALWPTYKWPLAQRFTYGTLKWITCQSRPP